VLQDCVPAPLDRVVEVLRFLGRKEVRGAFRIPGAARIDDDDRIAAWHPEGRVGRLERGVFRNVFVVYSGIEEALRVERDVLAVGGQAMIGGAGASSAGGTHRHGSSRRRAA